MKPKSKRLPKKRSMMYSIQLMPYRRRWCHLKKPGNAAPAIQLEKNAVFLENYNKELEYLELGLLIPTERISYRGKRIGGQDIIPRVLDQLDKPVCFFMATTACVEARYRLYLAKNQAERQPLFLFEQLAWDSWAPQDFGTIRTQPWRFFAQPIVQPGIPIGREYSNNPLTARRYRVADLKTYPLKFYAKDHVTNQQRACDWANLKTELQIHGPFVASFRPGKTWFESGGKTAYYGSQGASVTSHAVLVTGCFRFEGGRFFEIMNSYGTGWGDNGFSLVNMECLDWTLMPSIVPLDLHH